MHQDELYDLTIIGGGPVGLFAAFYAGMRKAKTKIIESLPQLGGQLSALYPEKKIYDVAGFPGIPASDLIHNLKKQVDQFPHNICLNQEVQQITKTEDGSFKIETDQDIHYSRSIIITTGNGSFHPRRLTLDSLQACENKSLFYFMPELEKFRNRRVAICGGGDSAVDWSLMLEPIAKEVTLIHRRNQFRAHEHSVHLLEKSSVNIKTPYTLTDVQHYNGFITQLTLQEPKNEANKTRLAVDDLIVSYGFTSSIGPIKEWNLKLEGNAIQVSSDMSTSIPGIYAAGDGCVYPGKVKLIATGLGEAPTAVNNALHFIDPKVRKQPGHSTSLYHK